MSSSNIKQQLKLSQFIKDVKKDLNKYDEVVKILNLEKKYSNLLWKIFSSKEFENDIKNIEKEIQNNYNYIQKYFDQKNKIKIPAERITWYRVLKSLRCKIISIFPSPISTDVAFVMKECIVMIDVKTLDFEGNHGDIENLQFESNQSTFKNINLDSDPTILNSGVHVESSVPTYYTDNDGKKLPILTFFLTICYKDDNKSFKLVNYDNTNKKYHTIYLKTLPNGELSFLYEGDLVDNFKTYLYDKQFKPVYLEKPNTPKDVVDKAVEKFVNSNKNFRLIKGRTKTGAYQTDAKSSFYGHDGVSWFPVLRTNGNISKKGYYLEAVKSGQTNRTSNKNLENRFDSNDEHWLGIKVKDIS